MNLRIFHILYFFALLAGFEVHGQSFILKGKVLDQKSHLPVADVVVSTENNPEPAITDKNGDFSLKVPQNNMYKLTGSHVAYVPFTYSLSKPTEKAIIYIEPKDISLSEVSVSANKRVSPVKEITVEPVSWESSITYISSKEIEQTGAVTTLDALKYSTNGLPSVQGRRKKYYYLVRGQNMASDYSINGISLSTNGAGPMAQWIEAPTMLPANMIESIEVVRSGNSLLLGFSGLNGVVNIKTKTFDHFETQAEASYGTFNSYRIGALHGGKVGDLNYAISIFEDKTDGPKGRHSYEDLWNIYGKVGYNYKNKVEINFENFYTYGTRFVTQALDYQGLTMPMRQLADIWEYDPMRYNISTARVKVNESKSASTEIQMSYILNRMDLYPDMYEFTVDPKTKEAVIGDSIVRAHMLNEPDTVLTLGLFQAVKPLKNNVLRLAAMYASSANYTHGKSKKTIYSSALVDQHDFGKTDVHAGIKLIREYYNYYVPNQGFGDASRAVKNEWQPLLFNFSTGVSYRFNSRFTLNSVVNSGGLPLDNTALQLLEDGSATQLNREFRTGLDIGLEYKTSERGDWMFTLFLISQKNTSEYTNRSYYDDDGLIRFYERNIDLSTWGVEIVYQSPLFSDKFMFHSNLSYKYAYQSSDSAYKKYIKQPPFIGNVAISYVYGKLDASFMAKYVSRYSTDRFLQKEVTIGNYFNGDINATYRFPRACLEVFGSVVNVFGVKYCTVSPIYPDFGRQMKIGLRVKI